MPFRIVGGVLEKMTQRYFNVQPTVRNMFSKFWKLYELVFPQE